MPAPLAPAAKPPQVDVTPFAGRYERVGVRIELENRDGTLAGAAISTGSLAKLDDDPLTELTLVPVSDKLFVTRVGDRRTWTPMVFYELSDGTLYLHMGARATPKITDVKP